MKKTKLVFAMAIASLVAACHKAPAEAPASEPASGSVEEKKPLTFAREALLPASSYIPVTMGYVSGDAQLAVQENNMRSLFWSGAPMDYDGLAGDFVLAYKDEKDTFKRSDLAKANKESLETAYNNAKKNNHFAILLDKQLGNIKKYDPAIKGFEVWPMDMTSDTVYQWSRPEGQGRAYNGFWGISLLGANAFNYVPNAEEEARKIEAALAQRRGAADNYNAAVIVYGRTVGYDKYEYSRDNLRRTAFVVIDGMSFVDPKTKEVLFTADKAKLSKEVLIGSKIKTENFALASSAR